MHPVTLKPVPDSQDGVSGHHFVANRVRFPSCWQLKISYGFMAMKQPGWYQPVEPPL